MDKVQSNGTSGPDETIPRAVFVQRHPAAPRWRSALADLTLRAEPPRESQVLLLDSFDRRLEQAGIELTASGQAPRVHCRIAGTVGPCDFDLERCPAFAWDLPRPHGLELAEVLEARGLEPLGTHETSLLRSAVLDEEEKVVAWIEEELHRVRPARADEWSPPAGRVVLRGVRGYGSEFQRLARALKRAPGLRAAAGAEFDPRSLLPPPPTRPGRWPNLPRRIRAFEGLARIGAAQLEAVEANEPGLRAGVDAEHLHDARVAVRRLRSLLGQLPGILDESEREHLVGELRWLAGCTGPARDLDTLLFELRFSEPDLRADLAPIVARLERERALRQTRLVSDLDSARCAALESRLGACFTGKKGRRLRGPRATELFRRVVRKRLRKRLRSVLARTDHASAASPPAELHELRIACKKLRYLLECCRGLVPAAVLTRPSADLKGMQTVLGTIQDAHVQGALVGELALELGSSSGPRELLALGRFQERILQRGAAARARYPEVAAALVSRASRAGFAVLVRALGSDGR